MNGRLILVSLAVSLGFLWLSAPLFGGSCSQKVDFYEQHGYFVTKIHVVGPFDPTRALGKFTNGDGLQIHARGAPPGSDGLFHHDAFLNSASDIGDDLNAGDKVGLSFVLPTLNNCDDSTKELEITYRVYHIGTSGSAAGGGYLVQIPPVKVSNHKLSQILTLQPAVGYDAARHFFGGGQLALQRKEKVPIGEFTVVGYGSSSSHQVQAHLSGAADRGDGLLSHLDWGLVYVDDDLPAGLYNISERRLSARFAAIGHSRNETGLTFHFGADLEGGHQQSNGPALQPSVGVSDSSVGSLKAYLGSSWTREATTLTASYGIQFGTADPSNGLDFVKQILNGSVSTSLVHPDHRELAFDAHFGAGWITSHGTLPFAERFFGGNVPSPFIPGDRWMIESDPILRSFPARNFANSDGPWGGTSFFSVGTNLSYTFWYRPLVPEDIAAKIEGPLNGQMKTFRSAIANSYVVDSQPYKDLEAAISSHALSIDQLQQRLKAMKKPGISPDLSSAVDDALGDLDDVDGEMSSLGKRNASGDALAPIVGLVVGRGAIKGYLSNLSDDLTTVISQLKSPDQDDDRRFLSDKHQEVSQLYASSLARYKAIDRKPAEAKADQALTFPNHVLYETLHSIDIYSISPTLLFDMARLGPQPSGSGTGLRYGIGPAVGFALVNVKFTVGYSFNVQQKPGEPRGAAVLGLTFENLF